METDRTPDRNAPVWLTPAEIDALTPAVAKHLGIPEDDVTADMAFAFARERGILHRAT